MRSSGGWGRVAAVAIRLGWICAQSYKHSAASLQVTHQSRYALHNLSQQSLSQQVLVDRHLSASSSSNLWWSGSKRACLVAQNSKMLSISLACKLVSTSVCSPSYHVLCALHVHVVRNNSPFAVRNDDQFPYRCLRKKRPHSSTPRLVSFLWKRNIPSVSRVTHKYKGCYSNVLHVETQEDLCNNCCTRVSRLSPHPMLSMLRVYRTTQVNTSSAYSTLNFWGAGGVYTCGVQ